jgi:hypothetical protein
MVTATLVYVRARNRGRSVTHMFRYYLYLLNPQTFRYDILLATEGVMYFILAILDFLAHSVDDVSSVRSAFKALDISIGQLK